MDYWEQTMQDDCYIISADGWNAGTRVREVVQIKNKDGKLVWPDGHDFRKGTRRFKSDLIPGPIMIDRYFSHELGSIQTIELELVEIERQIDDQKEEHGGEGGLLEDVIEGEGEKRKITAKSLKARLQ